ncbi:MULTISPECIES: hypothetical protein [unclassified Mycoplasma]|uniref:hypothetical protein n=1 Tax=unclassified Mycoplasma TaxID=2683645 RepID=UPI00211C00D2|nr:MULTISPECIES: hypothetical protein [unclassified Mycoplasma]UUM19526.1 hypothetical protein NPA11_01955 [Mycoplasma sp. 1578d]UUM24446.1 hypothetical protein NPA12_01930 [Mycoplasma sp. 3686d]
MFKNKRTLKRALLTTGATSVFGGGILGTALGILSYKNSQLKSKETEIISLNSEITVLKTEITMLREENTKLKNEVSSLEGVLKIVNAANDTFSGETNDLLNKLINSTEGVSSELLKNKQYQEYLKTHLNKLKNSLLISINVLLDKLKNLNELNSDKFKNEFLITKINQLNELIANINLLDLANTANFKENSQFLNDYQKRYHDYNLELVDNLNNEINQNKDRINQLSSKISDTSKKLQESILKSIQTTLNLSETVTVLKNFTDTLIEKSLQLGSKTTNEEFKDNLERLSKSLSDYQTFLQEQVQLARNSLQEAIKNDDFSTLMILDTDIFSSKIKYWTQLSSNYSELAINIYLDFYEQSLKTIAQNDKEIKQLNHEKEEINDKLTQALRDKTKVLANLKKLKESLTTSFKNSLNSIINSLKNIDIAIKASDASQKIQLSQRLNEQIANLERLKDQYASEDFINKYEPFVESALKTADQVIQEYKDNVLNVLKQDYNRTKQQLNEANKNLIVTKNLLQSKTHEFTLVNEQLKQANENLNKKEIQLTKISKELEQTRTFLTSVKNEKTKTLSDLSSTIENLKNKLNLLKTTANSIIEEAIKDKINVEKLRSLIGKSFESKDSQDYKQMNGLFKKYLAHYSNVFDEMLLLYKRVINKKLGDKDKIIATKDSDIQQINGKIKQYELEKIEKNLKTEELEKEIERARNQITNLNEKIISIEKLGEINGLTVRKKTVLNTSLDKDYKKELIIPKEEAISFRKADNGIKISASSEEKYYIDLFHDIKVFYFDIIDQKMKNFILTRREKTKKLWNDYFLSDLTFLRGDSYSYTTATTGDIVTFYTIKYDYKTTQADSWFTVSLSNDGVITVRTEFDAKIKVGELLSSSSSYGPHNLSENDYNFSGGKVTSTLVFVSAIAV